MTPAFLFLPPVCLGLFLFFPNIYVTQKKPCKVKHLASALSSFENWKKKVPCHRLLYESTSRAMDFDSLTPPWHSHLRIHEKYVIYDNEVPALNLFLNFSPTSCWLWLELGRNCLIWREDWFHSYRSGSATLGSRPEEAETSIFLSLWATYQSFAAWPSVQFPWCVNGFLHLPPHCCSLVPLSCYQPVRLWEKLDNQKVLD